MKPFAPSMAFSGPNAPSRIEADVYDLEIDGTIPDEIDGAWYRVGPDHQYPPFADESYFINGDGYLSMFRIGGGHVDLKTRFVRTERFVAERAARRALFGRYRNAYTDDASVAGLNRGTANTTMVWHGGRLLAHKEDNRPVEIDPDTLATVGEWSWSGALRSRTVTAHPKIDPVSGEMVFFGYEAEGDGSTAIAYCVADRGGQLVTEQWFELPYPAFVHDFAVTQNHVVFPVFPVVTDRDRLKAGGAHWMWDGSREAHVGIMRRGASVAEMRWFKRPACHAFHVINAYDDADGRVVVDLLLAQRCSFPFIEDVTGAPFEPMQAIPIPTRWTFDLRSAGSGFDEEQLLMGFGELPRIDDRRAARDYRYAWMPSFDPSKPVHDERGFNFNVLMQLDVKERSAVSWHAGQHGAFEEPQFVAVPSKTGREDGYLLAMVQYLDVNLSELMVFDAQRIEGGPIARARVPFRMKMATHSTWVDAAALAARSRAATADQNG